tara:strand:- start:2859 stop:3167 length:309 start_codon:yes stop_codon:yes gene_type:complete
MNKPDNKPVEIWMKNDTMKIWIGLQEPDKDFTANEICDRANMVIKKFGINDGAFGYIKNTYRKTSHEHKGDYIYRYKGSFIKLENHGRYFDLGDYDDNKDEV